MLKPGQLCLIIAGCTEALGKEVVTQECIGNVPGTEHNDYWLVSGNNIPVRGYMGQGAYQNWAYVRDPHLLPISPDQPVETRELELSE
jgi:hypothetical protein